MIKQILLIILLILLLAYCTIFILSLVDLFIGTDLSPVDWTRI